MCKKITKINYVRPGQKKNFFSPSSEIVKDVHCTLHNEEKDFVVDQFGA